MHILVKNKAENVHIYIYTVYICYVNYVTGYTCYKLIFYIIIIIEYLIQ